MNLLKRLINNFLIVLLILGWLIPLGFGTTANCDKLKIAKEWIKKHSDNITTDVDPLIFDYRIPGNTVLGIFINRWLIVVDVEDTEKMYCKTFDCLVSIVDHEMQHSQDGFWGTQLHGTKKHHGNIYMKAEETRQKFIRKDKK